jgi:two-component system nitrogen regulation sensor histidine kinase NtrY
MARPRGGEEAGGPVAEGQGGRIAVRLEPGAEGVAIVVEDDGIGLPDGEDRARLTEPYVTHKAKGTGLGLAIVKKIMEDHGGRLLLEDRPDGPGTRAVLILPAESAARRDEMGVGVGRVSHGA